MFFMTYTFTKLISDWCIHISDHSTHVTFVGRKQVRQCCCSFGCSISSSHFSRIFMILFVISKHVIEHFLPSGWKNSGQKIRGMRVTNIQEFVETKQNVRPNKWIKCHLLQCVDDIRYSGKEFQI